MEDVEDVEVNEIEASCQTSELTLAPAVEIGMELEFLVPLPKELRGESTQKTVAIPASVPRHPRDTHGYT